MAPGATERMKEERSSFMATMAGSKRRESIYTFQIARLHQCIMLEDAVTS
jgi:hypothetical protein